MCVLLHVIVVSLVVTGNFVLFNPQVFRQDNVNKNSIICSSKNFVAQLVCLLFTHLNFVYVTAFCYCYCILLLLLYLFFLYVY